MAAPTGPRPALMLSPRQPLRAGQIETIVDETEKPMGFTDQVSACSARSLPDLPAPIWRCRHYRRGAQPGLSDHCLRDIGQRQLTGSRCWPLQDNINFDAVESLSTRRLGSSQPGKTLAPPQIGLTRVRSLNWVVGSCLGWQLQWLEHPNHCNNRELRQVRRLSKTYSRDTAGLVTGIASKKPSNFMLR